MPIATARMRSSWAKQLESMSSTFFKSAALAVHTSSHLSSTRAASRSFPSHHRLWPAAPWWARRGWRGPRALRRTPSARALPLAVGPHRHAVHVPVGLELALPHQPQRPWGRRRRPGAPSGRRRSAGPGECPTPPSSREGPWRRALRGISLSSAAATSRAARDGAADGLSLPDRNTRVAASALLTSRTVANGRRMPSARTLASRRSTSSTWTAASDAPI